MDALIFLCLGIPGFIIFMMIFGSIKQINQYQKGVLFTFGKFSKVLEPGWHIILPVVQRVKVVDLRIMAVEVEGQDAMTQDNVSVHINAVVYYQVVDPAKAIIKVQDVDWAVNQFAQTAMRNVVGSTSLDGVLSNRKVVSSEIEKLVEHATDKWGVHIDTVELKDVKLPDGLKRTMAKVAEADRERRANILKSEGEVIAAKNLAEAAELMAGKPGAMHLRTLNSINDISSDQSNTVVFALPIEILRAIDGFGSMMRGKKKA